MAVLLGMFFLPQAHARQDLPACPVTELGETAQDCPWAAVARKLLEESQAGRPLEPTLEALLPVLSRQIREAATQPEILELWGRSINFDESAKGLIVEPAILDNLLAWAKAPARQDRFVHAGIEHTFGYLFSLLRTSYGYKRARWVTGEIDRGLALGSAVIHPAPAGGTLFWNVTTLLTRIALRDSAPAQRSIDAIRKKVSHELLKWRPAGLEVIRLVETLQAPRPIEIRTDFVKFPHPTGTPNTHLLIYSIRDGAQAEPRLISAFPVEPSFVERATDPGTLGDQKPVQTRYNAWIDGVTGKTWTGNRRLERSAP